MQIGITNVLKVIGYVAGGLVAIVVVYLLVAVVLSLIPVAARPSGDPKTVEIFIRSNGVHVDLVVPIRNDQMDWSQQIKLANTISNDPGMRYLAFGWGDKGFYLDTETWADLKFSTAFNAAFWLSTSAMHTTFYRDMQPGKACVRLMLTRTEYAQLIAYIQQKFQHDAAGNVMLISGRSYGRDDAFYEANGTYSFAYTCNTWANNGLKACGQKACLWTPSQTGIFFHYGQPDVTPDAGKPR